MADRQASEDIVVATARLEAWANSQSDLKGRYLALLVKKRKDPEFLQDLVEFHHLTKDDDGAFGDGLPELLVPGAPGTMAMDQELESVVTLLKRITETLDARARQEEQASVSFSKASNSDADDLVSKLGLREVEGNAVEPIEVPADVKLCDVFNYAEYSSENAGSDALMTHHEQQLRKFGVPFGRGGFQVHDLHQMAKIYSVAGSTKVYSGTVVACVAPYGLRGLSASKQAIVLYVHKQSLDQEQAFRDGDPGISQEDAQCSGSVRFRTHRGQVVLSILGAYASGEYPAMVDLTDGQVHHLMHIRKNELFVWEGLTPTQAYFKQSQLLNDVVRIVGPSNLRQFTLADIPEDMQSPVKKLRSLQPPNLLRQQLDSILPHVAPCERRECAYDILESWAQREPISLSVTQMYS